MADDAEHRGNSTREEETGRDSGEKDIIFSKLKTGSLKLYDLEKELPPLDAIRARREFIAQETGTSLENIGIFSIDIERVVKRNCENMIGTVTGTARCCRPSSHCGRIRAGELLPSPCNNRRRACRLGQPRLQRYHKSRRCTGMHPP